AEDGIEVALIPHTLAETTLSDRVPGDLVNIEVDVLAKYAERLVRTAAAVTMTADTRAESPFATVEEAIEDIRAGRFVVVVDDEDRENEGDLTIAAQFATPEAVNFMVT